MSPDLDRAILAARAAGEVLGEHAGRVHRVRYKSATQPVTDADHAADRVIREILLDGNAGDGWISEEDTPRVAGDRVWIVDPLDGTRNFIDGSAEYAVCIALLVAGVPSLGVIHNPASGAVYHAERGMGAWLDGRPIQARPAPPEPVLVASAAELRRPEFAAIAERFTVIEAGSTALKMARVAEGGADCYLSMQSKGIWDVCAGFVLVHEAGGGAQGLDGPFQWKADRPVQGTAAWGPGSQTTTLKSARLLHSICSTKPEEEA